MHEREEAHGVPWAFSPPPRCTLRPPGGGARDGATYGERPGVGPIQASADRCRATTSTAAASSTRNIQSAPLPSSATSRAHAYTHGSCSGLAAIARRVALRCARCEGLDARHADVDAQRRRHRATPRVRHEPHAAVVGRHCRGRRGDACWRKRADPRRRAAPQRRRRQRRDGARARTRAAARRWRRLAVSASEFSYSARSPIRGGPRAHARMVARSSASTGVCSRSTACRHDELLAIQATLRGGVLAPGGEGSCCAHRGGGDAVRTEARRRTRLPPPGLPIGEHATLPCHVCERASGYHCAICLGDVEAGQRVQSCRARTRSTIACVREWLRRAQVCPLCKTPRGAWACR